MPKKTILVFAIPFVTLVAFCSATAMFADTAVAPADTTTTTSTTSTTTTVPVNHRSIMESGVATTTTLVPLGFDPVCGEPLMRLALEVGWPMEQLPKLDRVARRESGGDCGNTDVNPSVNRDDPQYCEDGLGSIGTLQINSYWASPVKYNPSVGGWLGEHGVLDECSDLFDVRTNLTAGLLIWQRSGWGPWGG